MNEFDDIFGGTTFHNSFDCPPLFKRDAKKGVRIKNIRVQNHRGVAVISVSTGLYNGKKTVTSRDVRGKNIGKSNQTTPFQQAKSEALSDWKSAKDRGYKSMEDLGIGRTDMGEHEPDVFTAHNKGIDEREYGAAGLLALLRRMLPTIATDATGRVKAMKLHHASMPKFFTDWAKENGHFYPYLDERTKQKGKPIKLPCYLQDKKDGVCIIADGEVGLTTRGGKDRLTPKGKQSLNEIVPHVYEELKLLSPEYILNGELYVAGSHLQLIEAACKKKSHLSAQLSLYIFDVINTDWTMEQRLTYLDELRKEIAAKSLNYIHVVPATLAVTVADIIRYEIAAVEARKEEGIIIRHKDGKYRPDYRTSDVLKLVRFDSTEFKIVDVIAMNKAPEQGMFICVTDKFQRFRVNYAAPHEERRNALRYPSDYIGKWLTVYHRGYSLKGIPRLGTGQRIREFKSGNDEN